MVHTVRICKDLTGWFASIGDDAPGYPGVRVHWEQEFQSPGRAMEVLDLAEDLALQLRGEALLYWRPEPQEELPGEDRPAKAPAPAPPRHRDPWRRRRSRS